MKLLQYKYLGAAVLAGLFLGGAGAEQSRAALLAQWTFNSGTSADLTSDVGGYTLQQSGAGSNQTTTYNSDGTISLGAGRLLYTTAINSTDFSELKTGMTIWVRLKIDSTASGNAPMFGLINGTASLTGDNISAYGTTMRSKYANTAAAWLSDGGTNPTVKFTGITNSGTVLGPSTDINRVTLGEYIEVAITISDNGTLVYTDRTNGRTVSRSAGNADLADFQSFAIGRLWTEASNAITVDEIRIYNTALSDAEIDAISAIPVPEAATISMVALSGVALLRRKR